MVFIRKASGASAKPREQFIGRLVGISSNEEGVINAEQGLFNFLDLLFIEVDKDLNDVYDGKKEDGTPQPKWRKVRAYPSMYAKDKKESEVKPLSFFKELEAVDNMVNIEKNKPVDQERKFPIISLSIYKTLNEGKDKEGKEHVYKNYKASGKDLQTIKLIK